MKLKLIFGLPVNKLAYFTDSGNSAQRARSRHNLQTDSIEGIGIRLHKDVILYLLILYIVTAPYAAVDCCDQNYTPTMCIY